MGWDPEQSAGQLHTASLPCPLLLLPLAEGQSLPGLGHSLCQLAGARSELSASVVGGVPAWFLQNFGDQDIWPQQAIIA